RRVFSLTSAWADRTERERAVATRPRQKLDHFMILMLLFLVPGLHESFLLPVWRRSQVRLKIRYLTGHCGPVRTTGAGPCWSAPRAGCRQTAGCSGPGAP